MALKDTNARGTTYNRKNVSSDPCSGIPMMAQTFEIRFWFSVPLPTDSRNEPKRRYGSGNVKGAMQRMKRDQARVLAQTASFLREVHTLGVAMNS